MTARLGKVIKMHRVWRDMTQEKLASLAEISPGYLSEMERGLQNPGFKTLAKIAAALGIPLWQIVKEAEEMEGEE